MRRCAAARAAFRLDADSSLMALSPAEVYTLCLILCLLRSNELRSKLVCVCARTTIVARQHTRSEIVAMNGDHLYVQTSPQGMTYLFRDTERERLVIYRRAILAGFFTDQLPETQARLLFLERSR